MIKEDSEVLFARKAMDNATALGLTKDAVLPWRILMEEQ